VLYWLYERALLRGIALLPGHICFMLTEQDVRSAPQKIYEVTRWSRDISHIVRNRWGNSGGSGSPGIVSLTFHISTSNPDALMPSIPEIKKVEKIARLELHTGEDKAVSGSGIHVCVAIGKSGREEIVECIRRMANEHIPPESVTEETFERFLTFSYSPDLVIKTGGDHLTDFLIWQSVYSELFFSDINWKWFRKVDFLRALRDYQSRARRFGK
jgi:undecaprenyl diphosphate synthase